MCMTSPVIAKPLHDSQYFLIFSQATTPLTSTSLLTLTTQIIARILTHTDGLS